MRSTGRSGQPRPPRSDCADSADRARTSRRHLLTGALGIGLTGLLTGGIAACDPTDSGSDDPSGEDSGSEATPTPEPDPDLALLEGAAAHEQEFVDRYAATVAKHSALTDLLDPLAANHRAHVTYLSGLIAIAAREPLPAPLPDPATVDAPPTPAKPTDSPTSANPTPPTSSGEPSDAPANGETDTAEPVPKSASDALAALTTAEQDAATAHLADVRNAAGGEAARLFASLAACAQSHAFQVEQDGGDYVS